MKEHQFYQPMMWRRDKREIKADAKFGKEGKFVALSTTVYEGGPLIRFESLSFLKLCLIIFIF